MPPYSASSKGAAQRGQNLKGWLTIEPYRSAAAATNRSLADAESRKDRPQKVFGSELAGDLAQGFLRQAQLFGDEVDGRSLGDEPLAVGDERQRALQSLDVTRPRREQSLRSG